MKRVINKLEENTHETCLSKKVMLTRMANSSSDKSGKKINIDQDIADMLALASAEKETTKESVADDIMSFYFKKLYNLKLSDKINNIELNNVDIIDVESNQKVTRVTQNIKMRKNIAKILKFTSIQDAISQSEVFENASRFYFKNIYNKKLKEKIDEIKFGKVTIIDSNLSIIQTKNTYSTILNPHIIEDKAKKNIRYRPTKVRNKQKEDSKEEEIS